MSAPTTVGPVTKGRGPQPPAFGRPSPALLARADRGYARFLAQADPDDRTSDDGPDDAARHR